MPEMGISELEIMETDGIKHLIPLDKIKGGGPPKDGMISFHGYIFRRARSLLSTHNLILGNLTLKYFQRPYSKITHNKKSLNKNT